MQTTEVFFFSFSFFRTDFLGRDLVPSAECRKEPKDLLCDKIPHFFQATAIEPFHSLFLVQS